MNLTKNIVCFQKNFIYLNDCGVDNRPAAMTVQAELMRFGYMLDQDAFMQMGKADKADIVDYYNEVIDYLKEMTGGKRDFKPFYKGFPEEVMLMDDCEMWTNQILHYLSNGKWEPSPWAKQFETAFETIKYKMITPGDEKKFLGIFTDLCSVGNSLMPQD